MLVCRSSAKVNLTLDVLSRRADGYHELQSVVHTVGLWDTLTFEFGGQEYSLRCNEADLESDDNLCLRAARAWREAAHEKGVELSGLAISLQKIIPSGAGLGGGSGNAAATLHALNRHFDDCLSEIELVTLAAGLGADVPLFLRGGCALMEGVGEKLSPLPPLCGWLLLVKPQRSLSTPDVYRRWDELQKPSMRATPALLEAMSGDLEAVGGALGNDLAAAAQALGEDVAAIETALRRSGALGASMTGSGSCVFGVFDCEEAALAAQHTIQRTARAEGDRVYVAPFVDVGVEYSSTTVSTTL